MSENTLEKLIATLKSEAIEAADNEAVNIVESAHAQAKKIIKEAEAKREELLGNAEKEAQATLIKGEGALKQAARDLTVSVRNDLLQLLKTVLEKEVEAQFTPKLMEQAITNTIANVGSGVTLTLSKNVETELAKTVQKQLQAMDNLDSIITDPSLLKGFSITKTDQGWSYQISPNAVAELLNAHLSPKWVNLLKNDLDT
ncbi:hypothetical protein L0P88_01170 [Muricauda sp. SCSIO 64092]|uniref:hypothetical protein n=1 Tax=Allomuricauda sp. SCSIO 64092 TaxID=2908842 RepID=UPI001FF577BB|nr:hypothetical protein [Muricauda sp. SCSIO 64092]UOY07176.1 hypothetical protein L0P88_01170 [Muricauda sp. SCSIO 64092]